MKLYILIANLALAQGIQITGIPKSDIMQNQPNHWRKIWPQGDTDDGRDDDKIMFGWSENKASAPTRVKYPEIKLDEDVIRTQNSVRETESATGLTLSDKTISQRGLNRVDEYDNTKRVWERNMPFGNTWDKDFPKAPVPWRRADEPHTD